MSDLQKNEDQRRAILKAVEDREDLDLASLSKHIGKNHSYLHQFIHRGSPRELRDKDWKRLAAIIHLGEGEESTSQTYDEREISHVPLFGFRAGMGGGGVIIDENPIAQLPMRKEYLRSMRLANADLIAIEVEGDSMSPTLESGDQVLINRHDKNPVRGGIFAIFDSDTLVVKRLEKIPASDPVQLKLISDNALHNDYDVLADDTNIIGRVVWYARRI